MGARARFTSSVYPSSIPHPKPGLHQIVSRLPFPSFTLSYLLPITVPYRHHSIHRIAAQWHRARRPRAIQPAQRRPPPHRALTVHARFTLRLGCSPMRCTPPRSHLGVTRSGADSSRTSRRRVNGSRPSNDSIGPKGETSSSSGPLCLAVSSVYATPGYGRGRYLAPQSAHPTTVPSLTPAHTFFTAFLPLLYFVGQHDQARG